MDIRSAERFEAEVNRGFGHYRSAQLKKVIENLRRYHKLSADLQPLFLLDLKGSLDDWQINCPKEYFGRGGQALELEVRRKIEAQRSGQLGLAAGDILFRWVPMGLGQRGGERQFTLGGLFGGALQSTISAAQQLQDFRHRSCGLEGINLGRSAFNIEHVGIYTGCGEVTEIGGSGLGRRLVVFREHYDLVVRSGTCGKRIAHKARLAQRGRSWYYPIWELRNVSVNPHPGALLLSFYQAFLDIKDSLYKGAERNVLQQAVICSHFVNAVLYAAVRNASLAVATEHEFDPLFKVSPAQMWREFTEKQGIWREAQASFIGIQHQGTLKPEIEDLQALEVGDVVQELVSV